MALREVPRSARQLLQQPSAWKPSVASLSRCASTEAGPAVPDVETESGLMTPVVERKGISIMDPRKRASRREHELPHSRYRYHPPKYDRGPLHPIQPPPSSDPVARNFTPGPFNLPRLKQTYHSTIASDILTLTYQHKPPGTPRSPSGYDSRGPRGAEVLLPLEPDLNYHNIPALKAVHVAMYTPQAKKNPDHITVAKTIMQTISGVRPTVTHTRQSVSQWSIVKGDRTGVKVTMQGNQAYEFLDKVIHLVFPKIKEWKGIKGTTGDGAGNLAFGLEPQEMMHFPEVEANYSSYPQKMIPGCRIFVETTAKSDRHARLLFGAMGIPFYGKLVD
ncbi:mitochondrial 54S ribosomal protein YmL7/YmL5 [Apiospora hydei]|uniref:Mitochondrial 54S ribosomal protein YmL7/YmL5 n=1 Tax=Apiospora hydei TaxID=1337664 RepID=A0ABR1V589_9PEZI